MLIPDGRLSLREGAVAVWPDFDATPYFARMIEALGRGRGDRSGHPVRRPRRPLTAASSSTAPGETWYTVPAGVGQPAFSFQYKGLFPAIEEAGRVSFVYRFKLQGMVDDVPCAGCMGARLRDDAAAAGSRTSRSTRSAGGRSGRPWRSSRG